MRAYKYFGTLFPILLAALLCASIVPDRLLADDKDTSSPSTKSAPAKSDGAKIESPAPLTERERWLLDRVELLEKRGAELGVNNNRPAASSAEIDRSQPASAGAPPVGGAEDERSTTRGARTAGARQAPALEGIAA